MLQEVLYSLGQHSEINPFHELMVQAGHASSETTWRSYFHLLEDSLRHWTDVAVLRHKIEYKSASWWTGERPVNLRQSIWRGKRLGKHLLHFLNVAAKKSYPVPAQSSTNSHTFATRNDESELEKFFASIHILRSVVSQRCHIGML
jgi:hypothetical protein